MLAFDRLILNCFDCPLYNDEENFCDELKQKVVFDEDGQFDIFCPYKEE